MCQKHNDHINVNGQIDNVLMNTTSELYYQFKCGDGSNIQCATGGCST